jgi:hypothetical protein
LTRKKIKRPVWHINEGTSSVGTGPLAFNVKVARAHGWTDAEIERTYEEMSKLLKRGWNRARRRHPELYRRNRDNGDVLFVGPIGTPGHIDYHGPLNLPAKDYEPITGRQPAKPDRRTPGTDRRAAKRRTGDKLTAKLRETRKR